jgi:hypothetical protein
MFVETENLSIKILRTDKIVLRQIAKSEGEPVSVIVRRILRKELQHLESIPKSISIQTPIRSEICHGKQYSISV